MKKHLFVFLSVLIALSSCKVSEEQEGFAPAAQQTLVSPVYHASIEGTETDATKVYTDEALHVLWNANDYITIFPKTTRNKKYRFKGADGATGGDFEEASTDYGTGSDISYSYGVYPYNEATGYVFDDIISTYFPQRQTYRANSFGPEANLMVAKSSTTDLNFKNVGGYLCIKLYGEGFSVQSILLKGNSDETLAGPVNISFDAGNIPSMVFDDTKPTELSKEIVLKTTTPVALGATAAEAVTFWMVIPPVHFPAGFTIRIIDSNGGIHEKSTTKDLTFERNIRVPMKAFALEAVAPAPAPMGVHPFTGEEYVYDKTTDQVNLYEAEEKVWARFLLIRDPLKMFEIGPIPAGVAVGNTVTASVTTYVNGVKTETKADCKLTVQSLSGGLIDMVSDEGVRYVFRF